MISNKRFQIVVMGVSGCGKSTVGKELSKALDYTFYDGDDYHPQANIAKMQQGIPLDDMDRQDWLVTLNNLMCDDANGLVLACSALKQQYRETLIKNVSSPVFIYLKGDFSTIWARHEKRQDHYFQGKDMLKSQFDTLQEPMWGNVITVDVSLTVEEVVAEVMSFLNDLTDEM